MLHDAKEIGWPPPNINKIPYVVFVIAQSYIL